MLEQDFTIAHLTVFGEARDQTPEVWAAVAWTFNNRLALNPARYGYTVAEVCLKASQYSCWLQGSAVLLANWQAMLRADGPVFTALCKVVDDALERMVVPDPSQGSTHYWDCSISAPYWAAKATLTVRLGRLQFVKNVP